MSYIIFKYIVILLGVAFLHLGVQILRGDEVCGENKATVFEDFIDSVCVSFGPIAAFFVTLILSTVIIIWGVRIKEEDID